MRRGGLADLRGVAMVIRHARTSLGMTLLLLAVVALAHAICLWQAAAERPRLAAELDAGLERVRAAYPPPSARELAAHLGSSTAPAPPMGPPGTDPAARARPAVRRDRGGPSQGRGR
ncbi:hypothetical protein ACFQX6_44090 [Streptosporangium lutulentum]